MSETSRTSRVHHGTPSFMFFVYNLLAVLSVFFGLAALYSGYRLERIRQTFPPSGAFIEVEGTRLHYVDSAPDAQDKPVLVLIHGASANMRDFLNSLYPRLVPTHRVLVFDRPGHGWSERGPLADIPDPAVQARLFAGALKTLGVEKPVVLGHSWGGAVAVAWALHYGENVRAVVVMSGATHPWKGGVAWYHHFVRIPVIGEFFLRTLAVPAGALLVPGGVQRNFWPQKAPDSLVDDIGLNLLFRPSHFRANSEDTALLKSFLDGQAKHYPAITAPLVIITGNRDQSVFAKTHSYALHAQVPASELIRMEGVGHMPHYAAPDVIVATLTRLAAGGGVRPGVTTHPLRNQPEKHRGQEK